MSQQQLFADMALKAWNAQVANTNKFLDSISDDALLKETAPGRNTVIYLLGHLIAVNDSMISLLGLGEREYAHLDEAFIKNPDRSGFTFPGASTLRNDWKKNNETLSSYFAALTGEDWFTRHTSMTDEDLAKEPGRNKLSVLLSRTGHLAYHLGQMKLVK